MEESNIKRVERSLFPFFFFFVEDKKGRLVFRLLKNGNVLLWKMGRSIVILFYSFFSRKGQFRLSNENSTESLFPCSKNERIDQFFFLFFLEFF